MCAQSGALRSSRLTWAFCLKRVLGAWLKKPGERLHLEISASYLPGLLPAVELYATLSKATNNDAGHEHHERTKSKGPVCNSCLQRKFLGDV